MARLMDGRRHDDVTAIAAGIDAGTDPAGGRGIGSGYANHACLPRDVTTVRVFGMAPCFASSARRLASPSSPSMSSTQKPELAPVGIAMLRSGSVQ